MQLTFGWTAYGIVFLLNELFRYAIRATGFRKSNSAHDVIRNALGAGMGERSYPSEDEPAENCGRPYILNHDSRPDRLAQYPYTSSCARVEAVTNNRESRNQSPTNKHKNIERYIL